CAADHYVSFPVGERTLQRGALLYRDRREFAGLRVLEEEEAMVRGRHGEEHLRGLLVDLGEGEDAPERPAELVEERQDLRLLLEARQLQPLRTRGAAGAGVVVPVGGGDRRRRHRLGSRRFLQ